MKIKKSLLLLLGCALSLPSVWAGVTVEQLKCEGAENPLGISRTKPQLSWILRSDERGQKQTGYQVLVASTAEKLAADQGDVWDSGKVASDQSVYVTYGGKELNPLAEYFWKVRVYDKEGKPSSWSSPASWLTGPLKQQDWKASWITASRWFVPPALRSLGLQTRDRATNPDASDWAAVDLGQVLPIEKIRLVVEKPESFPLEFRIEVAEDFDFLVNRKVLVEEKDYKVDPSGIAEFDGKGLKSRYVRFFISKSPLVPRNVEKDRIFKEQGKRLDGDLYRSVVRQMEVISGGKNVALMRPTIGSSQAPFLFDGMPSFKEPENCPEDACPTTVAPLLRKSFELDQPVKRAFLSYAAHGMADLSINGKPIDETVMGPPNTDYTKRILFRTVDVTPLLAKGENVLGAVLGNGFFSPPSRGVLPRHNGFGQPRLLAQLDIELADGKRQTVVSDASWKWEKSEIINNDMWGSYSVDLSKAKPGWDKPGYSDTRWRNAGISESLAGVMDSIPVPQVKRISEVKPVSIEKPEKGGGELAVFERHVAGWPRLNFPNAKAKQTIRVSDMGRGVGIQYYVANDGPVVLEPRFGYMANGLKVRVSGHTEPLTVDNISMQQLLPEFRKVGDFKCSNPFLNELYAAVIWTYSNFYLHHPLDPMREKDGWGEAMHTPAYFFDMNNYGRKVAMDWADNQLANGISGNIAPMLARIENGWNGPWPSVLNHSWAHYLHYGDRRLIEENYAKMAKGIEFCNSVLERGAGKSWNSYPELQTDLDKNAAEKGLFTWGTSLADWCGNPKWMFKGPAPSGQFMRTAEWHKVLDSARQIAELLGKKEDAAKYAAMAETTKTRLNDLFLDRSTGVYAEMPQSQPMQASALDAKIVPDDIRPLTYQRLIDAVHSQDDHHGCGFISLHFLLRALTDNYETALTNKIVNQKTFPSWNTVMKNGALFENWEGGDAMMPTCGGVIGSWMYESVLGIRPDYAAPGFKKFILAPQPDPATGLTWAEGWHDSIYGRISSNWKIENGKLTMDAGIPVNTTATVRVPTSNPASVMLDGKPIEKSSDIKVVRKDQNAVFLEVQSGTYQFLADYK